MKKTSWQRIYGIYFKFLFRVSSDKYFPWWLVNFNSNFMYISDSLREVEFWIFSDSRKGESRDPFVYLFPDSIWFDFVLFWRWAEKVVIDRIIIVFCYQGEHLLGAEIAFKITNIINNTRLALTVRHSKGPGTIIKVFQQWGSTPG